MQKVLWITDHVPTVSQLESIGKLLGRYAITFIRKRSEYGFVRELIERERPEYLIFSFVDYEIPDIDVGVRVLKAKIEEIVQEDNYIDNIDFEHKNKRYRFLGWHFYDKEYYNLYNKRL